MNGTCNHKESWEKQTIWNLDNGAKVTVEFGAYGEMISRVDDAEGYWHCSDGIGTLPKRFEFVLPWQECVVKSCNDWIIRPMFNKIFQKNN